MEYIANILRKHPHLTALVESAETVLNSFDLTPLLMNLVDIAPVQAFPFLADQFGVLGYGGFILAETEEQQRALLKKGLELQRHKGTPWAIKESLKALGYGEPELITPSSTPFTLTYDGTVNYDGTATYQDSAVAYQWATFDVVLDLGEERGIDAESTATAVEIVKEYKPARSTLFGISFKVTLLDVLPISDDALSYGRDIPLGSETAGGILYDGTALYNGQEVYEGTVGDSLSIQVINTQGNVILIDTL